MEKERDGAKEEAQVAWLYAVMEGKAKAWVEANMDRVSLAVVKEGR